MGTLLEDLNDWYKDETYPPDHFDVNAETIAYNRFEVLRWGTRVEIVYRRDDEHAAVLDVEPATEMQNWGDYGDVEIYAVEPYEATVTKYRRV